MRWSKGKKQSYSKAKYGFFYNNPYDIAGKAIELPLNTMGAYASGITIGQGLGLDNQGQRNLGALSAINTGLMGAGSLIQTVRRSKEEKERLGQQLSNDYYKVPYDRYTYQDYLNDPYQPNAFEKGGFIEDLRGQLAHPGKKTRIHSPNITMKGVKQPILAKASTGEAKILNPGEDYYFKGADYVDEIPLKEYAKGGIHIKESNKGKFTAAAKRAGMGTQEYARHILANKERYSSQLVKRANFARNASKWKHQDGGEVSESVVFDATESVNDPVVFDAIPEREQEYLGFGLEAPTDDENFYTNFEPKPFFSTNQSAPKGGTIAVSHNNPGNIKWSNFAKSFGAREGRNATDGGSFAVFPDVETGLRAQRELLVSKNYRNLTVDAAMKRWSNNGYGAEIYPEISMKTMGSLTEGELRELQKRQIRREDVNMYKQLFG